MENLNRLQHALRNHTGQHQKEHTSNRQRSKLLLIAFLLSVFSLSTAQSQTWQRVYGANNEQGGRKKVMPVSGGCIVTGEDNGYIAVGWSLEPGSDVYVLRTDNHGTTLWEYTYDINSVGIDVGESIVQLSDGTGFVVVGHTTAGSNTDLFLMKIDCDGIPVWTQQYGATSALEFGYDVIEEINSSDLIVAGERKTSSGSDAYLLRTDNVGSYIWENVIDQSAFDAFRSLTILSNGDLMAVGYTSGTLTAKDGFAVRAFGATGGVISAGIYGNDIHEDFYSVIELQNPNEFGPGGLPNVVIAGITRSYTNTDDDYFVKLFDGDPCITPLQVVHYTPGELHEGARDIKEIPFVPGSGAGYSQWDLAFTGYNDLNSIRMMSLRTLNPTSLFMTGLSMVYGQFGSEEGWSLYPLEESAAANRSEGFILCGVTTSDWYSNLDPADLYLVKTDRTGSAGTSCEFPHGPVTTEVDFGYHCITPLEFSPSTPVTSLTPPETLQDWDDPVCTNGTNGAKRVQLKQEISFAAIKTVPNPVPEGMDVVLIVPNATLGDKVTVTVVNALGENIPVTVSQITHASGEITIDTDNLTGGTYRVSVSDGETKWLGEIVILK
ncbi:MAG: hypothetical protein AB7H80_02535 [Candidatus Kapaibacterium sp.]